MAVAGHLLILPDIVQVRVALLRVLGCHQLARKQKSLFSYKPTAAALVSMVPTGLWKHRMSVSSSRRSSLETSENLQLAPVELETDNKIHLEPIDEETKSHGKVCSYIVHVQNLESSSLFCLRQLRRLLQSRWT